MTGCLIPDQVLLPLGSVKLGRFITCLDQPHQNYHDPPSANPPTTLTSHVGSYNSAHHKGSSSNARSKLTSLMSVGFSKRTKHATRITTDRVKGDILDNSESWFNQVTNLSSTRSWIERQVDRGYNVYLVVGIYTVTEASIKRESSSGKNNHGQLQASLSMVPGIAGASSIPGLKLDVGTRVSQEVHNGIQLQFTVQGECICAVEYRQLCYKWLSRKDAKKPRLSNVRQWSSLERLRQDQAGEDDIDVIRVDLLDVQVLAADLKQQAILEQPAL